MDYSEYYEFLIEMYKDSFLRGAVLTILVFCGMVSQLYNFYRKKTDGSLFIAGLCLVAFLFLSYDTIRFINDIPYVKKGEYFIATGVVTVGSTTKNVDISGARSFGYLVDNGKEITLSVYHKEPIYVGERYEVMYLPNCKRAVIIRKIVDD
jgi:hypothetical protein